MSMHSLKTGYISEGSGRYFMVRYCENCNHYNVLDLTRNVRDDLDILEGAEWKRKLAQDCPEAVE